MSPDNATGHCEWVTCPMRLTALLLKDANMHAVVHVQQLCYCNLPTVHVVHKSSATSICFSQPNIDNNQTHAVSYLTFLF